MKDETPAASPFVEDDLIPFHELIGTEVTVCWRGLKVPFDDGTAIIAVGTIKDSEDIGVRFQAPHNGKYSDLSFLLRRRSAEALFTLLSEIFIAAD